MLASLAQPFLEHNRAEHAVRTENVRRLGTTPPPSTRTYHELSYAAGSWPQPFRTVLKAEVMARGDNPRFVVTSLELPSPECVYWDLYCARGQDELVIKRLKSLLHIDRLRGREHSTLAALYSHGKLLYAAVLEKRARQRCGEDWNRLERIRRPTPWRVWKLLRQELAIAISGVLTWNTSR